MDSLARKIFRHSNRPHNGKPSVALMPLIFCAEYLFGAGEEVLLVFVFVVCMATRTTMAARILFTLTIFHSLLAVDG